MNKEQLCEEVGKGFADAYRREKRKELVRKLRRRNAELTLKLLRSREECDFFRQRNGYLEEENARLKDDHILDKDTIRILNDELKYRQR